MIHTREPENKIGGLHIHIKAQIGGNMQRWQALEVSHIPDIRIQVLVFTVKI